MGGGERGEGRGGWSESSKKVFLNIFSDDDEKVSGACTQRIKDMPGGRRRIVIGRGRMNSRVTHTNCTRIFNGQKALAAE